MGRTCSSIRGRILVGNPEPKRSTRRPRHIWEDNIKIDVGEIG
jgi:hypothetical protein